MTLGLIATLAAVAAALWLVARFGFRLAVDRRYSAAVTGGRSGSIILNVGERSARAEYEVGLDVDKIIYYSSLAWADGSKMTDQEKAQFIEQLKAWSTARHDRIVCQ